MSRRLLQMTLAATAAVALLTAPRPTAQNFAIPAGARAEAPDPNIPLYFEAASVKLNKGGEPGAGIQRRPGGRLNTINAPGNLLVTFAYQLQGFQLLNVPDWLRNDRWDIVAKIEGDPAPVNPAAGPDHMMLAMRTLLADRFKLKFHREVREMDIYQLVMARPGGKPGAALKPSTDECGQRGAGAPRPQGGGQAGPPTRPDGTPIFCGMRQQPGRVQFNGMPLAQFASGISPRVGRQVLDRTGLTGEWSFELTFAPTAQGLPPGVEPPAPDPNLPDLFTAVQEQLGLKLESVKGQVEVFVIDSIERPTED